MPAKRAYGMDQDFYPWSPIITRPILRWPDNARVALAVIVNLEHWDWEVPPHTPLAVSPLGGPEGLWSGNQPDFPDIGGYGNHEYGNRVGIFRVLAILDKYGIKPTLALDKAIADHYPFLIQEGQRRDAEFIAHGLSRRRIIHNGMSEDEERQYIRDSIAAVEQATGTRPVGWSGPDFQETPHTPDLLAAEGIRYVCDWGNDEQPYQMTPKTGELYALEPLGDRTLVDVKVGSELLKVKARPSVTGSPGDRLSVAVDLDRAHLFDAGSGLALSAAGR